MEIIGFKDKDFALSICSTGFSPLLLKGEKAEIIIECENTDKIKIFINGKEILFYSIFGNKNTVKADFCFEKAGENVIEIYSSDKLLFSDKVFASLEDKDFKIHFCDMKSFIREVVKEEIEEAYLKFLPQIKALSRKAWSRWLYNLKMQFIRNYNEKDRTVNRLLKYRMEKMIEFERKLLGKPSELEKFICFPPFKGIFKKADKDFNAPVLKGEFFEEDSLNIEKMYKFFGFICIYKILKDNFKGGEASFVEETENGVLFDINKKHSIVFFNTETETKIELLYCLKEDLPEIFLKTTKKGWGEESVKIYAFESIYTKDFSKAQNLSYKRKLTITKKDSKIPLLYDAISLYIGEREEENIISLLPGSFASLENLIKNILKEDNNLFLTPEEISGGALREDFENRSVCVAVCKTKSQFNLNLREKFYYIPQRYVESDFVTHIALYQSRNLFGEDAGISYIGEVKKISLVPRYKIEEIPSNNDEMYYRYDIKEWRKLERKIKPKAFSGVCVFTNMFLIENASYADELNILTYESYIMRCAKERLKTENEVLFKLNKNYYKMTKESLTTYTPEGEIIKHYETGSY